VNQPYSERFLHGRSTNGQQVYTVPAGHRAVVKCITVQTFTVTGAYGLVRCAGQPLLYLVARTVDENRTVTGQWVAYEGELIEALTGAGDVAWHVAGYLLADPAGRAAKASALELGEHGLRGHTRP